MVFTINPKTATTISSSEMAELFKQHGIHRNRHHTGFAITGETGSSLNATLTKGVAYVSGFEVGDVDIDSDEAVAFTANSTNHVYLKKDGSVTINTTGTAPADSMKIWEVVTNASGVTSKTDKRDSAVGMDAQVKAQKYKADGADPVYEGGSVSLEKAQPLIDLKDTNDGVKTRIRAESGKLRVYDVDSGGTETLKTDDLRVISNPVDETSTDATKNKTVSNLLAKGWQDHKNAAAPHSGHELTANKGIANGYASLDAGTKVLYSQLPAARAGTSAPGSPSPGDLWVETSDLKFRDNAGAPVTQTAERQINKGVASGYASLDSGGVVPSGQLPLATTSARGAVEIADSGIGGEVPQALGDSGAVGSLSVAARADHIHAHGDRSAQAAVTHHGFAQISGSITAAQHGAQTDSTLHALATASVAGFLPAVDKAKLDDATSAATASKLVIRDAAARAQFADPSANADAATKGYVDLTAGTTTATADKLARRDGAGKLFGVGYDAGSARITSVADPTANQDSATKKYVDDNSGAFAKASLGRKVFETVLLWENSSGQHGSIGGQGGPNLLLPEVKMGRTDGTGTFYPTGTVIKLIIAAQLRGTTGIGSADLIRGSGGPKITYYEAGHASKPNNVELITVKESDGTTETTTLDDWVSGTTIIWEVRVTVQGNSSSPSSRIYDIVLVRDGTTVATLTGRRGGEGGLFVDLWLSAFNGGNSTVGVLSPLLFQVTLP